MLSLYVQWNYSYIYRVLEGKLEAAEEAAAGVWGGRRKEAAGVRRALWEGSRLEDEARAQWQGSAGEQVGARGGGDRLWSSTWYFEGPLTALGGLEAKKIQKQEGQELALCNICFQLQTVNLDFPLHFFPLKDELSFLDSSSPNKEFLLLQDYLSSCFLSYCLWFCFSIMFLTFPSPAAHSALFSSPFPSQFAHIFLWLFLSCYISSFFYSSFFPACFHLQILKP